MPCPSVRPSRPRSASLAALALLLRRPLVGHGAGPRAGLVRLGARGRGPGRGSGAGQRGQLRVGAVPGHVRNGHVALAVLCRSPAGLDLFATADNRLRQPAVGSQRVTGVAQQAELAGEAEAVGVAASLADQRQVGVVEGVVADQVILAFRQRKRVVPLHGRGSSDAACVSRPCGGTGRGFPG